MGKYGHVLVGKGSIYQEAQALLNRISGRTTTIDQAWIAFVKREVNAGRWEKARAVYPFLGGTAENHKWNAKNPEDTDVAHRLVFAGTITHDPNGIKGNGVDGTANTFIKPSDFNQDSIAGFGFSRDTGASDTSDLADACDFGVFDSNAVGTPGFACFVRTKGHLHHSRVNAEGNSFTNNSAKGFFGQSRTLSTGFSQANSTVGITSYTRPSVAPLTSNINLMAIRRHHNQEVVGFSDRQYSFFWFGEGLTEAETHELRRSVELLQSDLGRWIYESESPAYLNVLAGVSIENKLSFDRFVTGAKAVGIWTLFRGCYPFLGGTAANHKWNAKNPNDSDASYRVSWSGTLVHDNMGVKGSGSSGLGEGNTFFNPSQFTTLSFGAYLNEPNTVLTSDTLMGIYTATGHTLIYPRWSDGLTYYDCFNTTARLSLNHGENGLLSLSRINDTDFRGYRRGVEVSAAYTGAKGTPPNATIRILSRGDGGHSTRRISFSYVGLGLQVAEMVALNKLVHQLQIDLGRNAY